MLKYWNCEITKLLTSVLKQGEDVCHNTKFYRFKYRVSIQTYESFMCDPKGCCTCGVCLCASYWAVLYTGFILTF